MAFCQILLFNFPFKHPELFKIHFTIEDRMVLFVNRKSELLKRHQFLERNGSPCSVSIRILQHLLSSLPLCLTAGCEDSDLRFLAEIGISKSPLSVSTTKTAALQWVKQNQAAVIAPVDDQEIIDSEMVGSFLPPQPDFQLSDRIFTQKSYIKSTGFPFSPFPFRKFLNFTYIHKLKSIL